MGVIRDAFGWMTGITAKSIDKIDVAELEQKLRGTKKLQAQWERDIKVAVREYNDEIDPDRNLRRSSVERGIAIQKAKIAAKRAATLTSAVKMLYKMSGTVERIKLLKRFYQDLCETTKMPKGLTLEQFIQHAETLSDVLGVKREEIDGLSEAVEDINRSMETTLDTGGAGRELEALFEKYATLVAEGKQNTPEATEVKARIDKLSGIAELA